MANVNDVIRLDLLTSYQLLRKLDGKEDSMFYELWIAQRCSTDRRVIVKLIKNDLPTHVHKFVSIALNNEIAFLEKMSSDSVITCCRGAQVAGNPILVMEQMEYSLSGYMSLNNATKALSLNNALDWLLQITEGLRVIHRDGYKHLDLKPQNLLLTATNGLPRRIKIGDFGTSLPLATQEHDFAGTPGWQAPEQFFPIANSDSRFLTKYCYRTDHRTDFYALGLVFFYMLTGEKTRFAKNCVGMHRYEKEHEAWRQSGQVRCDFQPEDRLLLLACLGESGEADKEEITWIPGFTTELQNQSTLLASTQKTLALLSCLLASEANARPQSATDIREMVKEIQETM